jgi:uncharacterized protein (TIGR00369 family)
VAEPEAQPPLPQGWDSPPPAVGKSPPAQPQAQPPLWQPGCADYEREIREVFASQKAMTLIGATLSVVEPGYVEVRLPFREDLTQHDGILHGGVVGMVLDSACAFAAGTLLPPDTLAVSLEYKVNFVAPAAGDELVVRGRVIKPGRTITVASGEAFSVTNGQERLSAVATETVMRFSTQP